MYVSASCLSQVRPVSTRRSWRQRERMSDATRLFVRHPMDGSAFSIRDVCNNARLLQNILTNENIIGHCGLPGIVAHLPEGAKNICVAELLPARPWPLAASKNALRPRMCVGGRPPAQGASSSRRRWSWPRSTVNMRVTEWEILSGKSGSISSEDLGKVATADRVDVRVGRQKEDRRAQRCSEDEESEGRGRMSGAGRTGRASC